MTKQQFREEIKAAFLEGHLAAQTQNKPSEAWENANVRGDIDYNKLFEGLALASASASPHPENVDDMLDTYVPGNWRCPQCNYVLSSQTLFVGGPDAGSIGSTREQVMALSGEVCPNDGTPMARVTWRERAIENQKWGTDLMEQVIAAVKAKSLPDALKRLEERFTEAPEIRCQYCGEDIRYIDGQWLDRETHNTCDQPEGQPDRHHAPLESWVEHFRAFTLPASASPHAKGEPKTWPTREELPREKLRRERRGIALTALEHLLMLAIKPFAGDRHSEQDLNDAYRVVSACIDDLEHEANVAERLVTHPSARPASLEPSKDRT